MVIRHFLPNRSCPSGEHGVNKGSKAPVSSSSPGTEGVEMIESHHVPSGPEIVE